MTQYGKTRRAYQTAAVIGGLLFAILLFASASVIRINGAILAPGVIMTEGNNTVLQHPDGGRVELVLVSNGDVVAEGDVILELDGAELRAEKDRLSRRALELDIRIRRLTAALDGETSFSTPYLRGRSDIGSDAEAIIEVQQAALIAEQAAIESDARTALARARGATQSARSVLTQQDTSQKRIALIDAEIADIEALVADKLVPQTRLTRLEREKLDILQRIEGLSGELTRFRNLATEARLEAESVRSKARDRQWREREQAETEHADILRRLEQVVAQLDRLTLTAPVGGEIHELSVSNPGAVIAPGDTVLQIVPRSEDFDVNVRIAASDVDDVFEGQAVRLRFDTVRQVQSRELDARISELAADRSTDPATGEVYFQAVVDFTEPDTATAYGLTLEAGLPVTALIETRHRSILAYLLEPVTRSFDRTFADNESPLAFQSGAGRGATR